MIWVIVIHSALCVGGPLLIPLTGILAVAEMEEKVGRKNFLLPVTGGKQAECKQNYMDKLATRTY